MHIRARGLEPEGAWKHAGGMFQPEVACAAAQVESHHRHQKSKASRRGPWIFAYLVKMADPEKPDFACSLYIPEVTDALYMKCSFNIPQNVFR